MRLLVKVEDKSPWYPVCIDCWRDGGCREHSRPDDEPEIVGIVWALAEALEDRPR